MSQVQYGGTIYDSLEQAAAAWAVAAAPDPAALDLSYLASSQAAELEDYIHAEASKLPERYAPAGVEEGVWRGACYRALRDRLKEAAHAAAVASGEAWEPES